MLSSIGIVGAVDNVSSPIGYTHVVKLKYPFSDETRLLYLYRTDCSDCGSNKMLELHHVEGRKSDSVLNSVLLCHDCHEHTNQTDFEKKKYYSYTLKWLLSEGYEFTQKDLNYYLDVVKKYVE